MVGDPNLGIGIADMTVITGMTPLAPAGTIVYYYNASLDTSLDNTASVEGLPTLSDGTPTGQATVNAEDTNALLIYVYDPPFGINDGSFDSTETILTWFMVWVNDSEYTAEGVVIGDTVPSDLEYRGDLSCVAYGSSVVTSCTFIDPNVTYPDGRIEVVADIAPNPGVLPVDSYTASNRIEISFASAPKDQEDSEFSNQAELVYDADKDGNPDFIKVSDDLGTSATGDPTGVLRSLPNTGSSIGIQFIAGGVIVLATGFILQRTSKRQS